MNNTDLYDLYSLQSNKIFIILFIISFIIIFSHVAHCISNWHLLKRDICNGPNTIHPIPVLSLSLFLSHPPSSLRFSLFFLPLRAPPFEIHCPDRKRAWDSKGSLSAHFFENYLRLRSFCEMNIWCGGPERLPRRAQSNTSENDWAEVYSSQLQNTHTHTHTPPHPIPLITIPPKNTPDVLWRVIESEALRRNVWRLTGCRLTFLIFLPSLFFTHWLSFYKVPHKYSAWSFALFFVLSGRHCSCSHFRTCWQVHDVALVRSICPLWQELRGGNATTLFIFLPPQECRVESFRDLVPLLCDKHEMGCCFFTSLVLQCHLMVGCVKWSCV